MVGVRKKLILESSTRNGFSRQEAYPEEIKKLEIRPPTPKEMRDKEGFCYLCGEASYGRRVTIWLHRSEANPSRPTGCFQRCEGCLGQQLMELGLVW